MLRLSFPPHPPNTHTHTGMADEGSTPLLTPGSFLRDHWEVLKKIGGGGVGEIYKGRDITTGKVSG